MEGSTTKHLHDYSARCFCLARSLASQPAFIYQANFLLLPANFIKRGFRDKTFITKMPEMHLPL